ncbi:MAG TPA: OmpA family protein [Steroidobacteraceae bacterium]|nr:OmpA family protein [Steroidobacteraceae bacterium]
MCPRGRPRRAHLAWLHLLAGLALAFPVARGAAEPLVLQPGLTVTSAVHDSVQNKDYEAVEQVLTVDEAGMRVRTQWGIPDQSAPEGVRVQTYEELVRAEDRRAAHRLLLWYLPGDAEVMPGTTPGSPSDALFDDIKSKGEADIVVGAVSRNDGGLFPAAGALLAGRKYFRGRVRLQGRQSVRVLIDGVPAQLDALDVRGHLSVGDDSGDVHFLWLDARELHLSLAATFQGSTAQVVRIDLPPRPPPPDSAAARAGSAGGGGGLQRALASGSCRSEVPGIYFLSDSARLLEASRPSIERLAALLKAEPSWAVTIEGHTDSTGGDAYNLALSQRRADALKAELVQRYGIAATRLSTQGYGRTRPVDTNDTMDGRAHNRRVELARRC